MVFGVRHPHLLDLSIVEDDGSPSVKVLLFKYLGLWVHPELTFKPRIDFLKKKKKKAYGCLDTLYCSINCLTMVIRKLLISRLILPIIDYVDIVYQITTYLTHHYYMYD